MRVFNCSHCEQEFKISSNDSSSMVSCPHCGEINSILLPSKENERVQACPTCSGNFRVPTELMNTTVVCPHCNDSLTVGRPEHQNSTKENEKETTTKTKRWKSSKSQPEQKPSKSKNQRHLPSIPNAPPPSSVAHLLPPKFEVKDPVRLAQSVTDNENIILLPNAEGGHTSIDSSIVHIEHGGKKIAVKVLTPEQRAWRRLLQNLVVIGTGVLFIVASLIMLLS